MRLETLSLSADRSARLAEMKEIFFLSAPESIQNADEETREKFWQRWTSYYIQSCADELFFAFEDDCVLGYLTGCQDSQAAAATLSQSLKSFALFEDCFEKFPAHLHINVHPSARGIGIGATLIEHYVQRLRSKGVRGVHIVTAPGERNVDFYLRQRFRAVEERALNGQPLLLMGRSFDS